MNDVEKVYLFDGMCAVIKKDRSLWTWGYNNMGQLGDGTTDNRTSPVKIMDGVEDYYLDDYCAAAIKTDRSLWMWGYNGEGQLGDGTYKDKKAR